MRIRPEAVFLDGRWERGLELELEPVGDAYRILGISATTLAEEPGFVSPALANAHSHLEYRGLQDQIEADEYWPWIRELTRKKAVEPLEEVEAAVGLAAGENAAQGIRLILEHSDRPFSAGAMARRGLGGRVYQELITFLEMGDPAAKWEAVEAKAVAQRVHGLEVALTPHAAYTVDEESLRRFATGGPFSIHVAETPLETEFFRDGTGPIANLYLANGYEPRTTGETVVGYLDQLGLARPGAQWVHCCALEPGEEDLLAERGVAVAHCPRSNERLQCPEAPIRRLLDAGVNVALGLDSPASSGPIDMLAEMRSAATVALRRGEVLLPEQIWAMATVNGAAQAGLDWTIEIGHVVPLLRWESRSGTVDNAFELRLMEPV